MSTAKPRTSRIQQRRAAAAAADNASYLERQRAIRAAAGEVFAEKGFHATRLSDVAERVQMDRATLYYYVGSKDDLFREVVSKAVATNVAEAEAIAGEKLPAGEKLERLIRQLMSSFERDYPYLYVFVQEDPTKLRNGKSGDDPWDETLQLAERYYAIVRKILEEALESGDLHNPLPASVVAYSIIGMLNSSRLWFHPDGQMSGDQIGAGLAHLILYGLTTPA